MQFIFGDKREAYQLDESVLPVTEKERKGEGKRFFCGTHKGEVEGEVKQE